MLLTKKTHEQSKQLEMPLLLVGRKSQVMPIFSVSLSGWMFDKYSILRGAWEQRGL